METEQRPPRAAVDGQVDHRGTLSPAALSHRPATFHGACSAPVRAYLGATMPDRSIQVGDTLTGPLFSEPVRVVTAAMRPDGSAVETEGRSGEQADSRPPLELTSQSFEELSTGPAATTVTLKVVGSIPPELWNRLGTKLIPKLKGVGEVDVGVSFSVVLSGESAVRVRADIERIFEELGIGSTLRVDVMK